MTAQAGTTTTTHKNAFEFSERIQFDGTGIGGDAGHGNHQTRVVHTTHGDYVAYITNSTTNSSGARLDEFKVIRVNEDRSYEVILTEYKIYDSSQVGLFVDKDENVWAVTVGDNKYRQNSGTDAIAANAWMIDKETDDVTNYGIIIPRKTWSGYGYSYFCYDETMNKLYTLTTSGDEPGELVWLIFDLETKTWDNTARSFQTASRNAYPYMYADGKGGMIIVNQRDFKCTTVGYPEIGNNNGLSAGDLGTFSRWSADYVWDQLELYYIPDVYEEEYEKFVVAEADYSRVQGTQEDRYKLEYRKINEYPNFQNNNGGDTYLDDAGYLHVIYAKEYLLAAYTRERTERSWYHDVIDISNPSNIKKLSSTKIIDDAPLDYNCTFRMYQTTDGNLYLISGQSRKEGLDNAFTGEVVVYYVNGTPQTGYEYEKVASASHAGNSVINVANNRSNSIEDDVIPFIWMNGDGSVYRYRTIKVTCAHSNLTWDWDDDDHWQNCDDCDKEFNKGAHSFEWVDDKEPSYTEPGYKHEECKTCGATRNERTEIPQLEEPIVGDNDMTFWILLIVSMAALTSATVVLNKKKRSVKQ